MRESEVKKLIGEENWADFGKWMRGQTVVGTYPDGELNYYSWDVAAFKQKLDTGYDRQENPLTWD